jgi:4-diphosphocytidyl-2-C-methyl-D-erythritol kinase
VGETGGVEPDGTERLVRQGDSGERSGHDQTSETGGTTEVSAPAKLTLSLTVTGVHPDGYHEIESEMVTLDLADTLEIGLGDGLTIESGERPRDAEVSGSPDDLAADVSALSTGPDNLVIRALLAVDRAARVRLIKRIPVGAGLGGGSADAAAILRWAGSTDLDVAANLGADVPFCVAGGRALVKGIGESVTPLVHKDEAFTLLLLPFGVDTGAVYRAWDSLALQRSSPPAGVGNNDLEMPAISVEPRLALWRDVFATATGAEPRLAGSGSTWFVEGTPESLGLGGRRSLALGRTSAQLISVRTVPAQYTPVR